MKNNIILVGDDVKLIRVIIDKIKSSLDRETSTSFNFVIGTAFWKAAKDYEEKKHRTPEYYKELNKLFEMELDVREQYIIILKLPNESELKCAKEFLYEDYNSLSGRKINSKTRIFFLIDETNNLNKIIANAILYLFADIRKLRLKLSELKNINLPTGKLIELIEFSEE